MSDKINQESGPDLITNVTEHFDKDFLTNSRYWLLVYTQFILVWMFRMVLETLSNLALEQKRSEQTV